MLQFLLLCLIITSNSAFSFSFNFRIFNHAGIIHNGIARTYIDGSSAKSCQEYKTQAVGKYQYKGSIGNGMYSIKPGSSPAFNVYCDMTGGAWDNFAGGYTLIGVFNTQNQIAPQIVANTAINTNGYISDIKYQELLAISSQIIHSVTPSIIVRTAKSSIPSINCYNNSTSALPEILGGTTFLWFHSENSGCSASGGDHSEIYYNTGNFIVFSSAGGFSSYWTGINQTFQTDGAGYDIRKTFTITTTDSVFMYLK